MITIHHEYFPHIIDTILAHLDYPGVSTARKVCKVWRHRANRLFRHVTVISRRDKDIGRARSELRARDVHHPHIEPVLYIDPEEDRRDTDVEEDAEYWADTLQHIEAVDIVYFQEYPDPGYALFHHVRQAASIIRWHGTPITPVISLPGQAVVFFLDLIDRIVGLLPQLDVQSHHNVAPLQQCKEIIFNFACYVDPTTYCWAASDSFAFALCYPTAKRVIVILNSVSVIDNNPKVFVGCFLRTFINMLAESVDLYIVGLELFIPSPRDRMVYLHNLVGLFSKQNPTAWNTPGIWPVREHCHFLTREEYQMLVGQEKYLLHTVK